MKYLGTPQETKKGIPTYRKEERTIYRKREREETNGRNKKLHNVIAKENKT